MSSSKSDQIVDSFREKKKNLPQGTKMDKFQKHTNAQNNTKNLKGTNRKVSFSSQKRHLSRSYREFSAQKKIKQKLPLQSTFCFVKNSRLANTLWRFQMTVFVNLFVCCLFFFFRGWEEPLYFLSVVTIPKWNQCKNWSFFFSQLRKPKKRGLSKSFTQSSLYQQSL